MILKHIEGDMRGLIEGGRSAYHMTKLLELLEEFNQSEEELMEVTGWENEYKRVDYAAAGLRRAAQHFGFNDVKLFVRHDRLFMRRIHHRAAKVTINEETSK